MKKHSSLQNIVNQYFYLYFYDQVIRLYVLGDAVGELQYTASGFMFLYKNSFVSFRVSKKTKMSMLTSPWTV